MANPNIAAATSITGETNATLLTTAAVAYLTTPSDTVFKVNSLTVANITASGITVDVTMRPVASPTTLFNIAKSVSVPANTTLVLVSKDTSFYIPEGGSLFALCSATSSAHMVVSYEAIS